MTVRSVLYVLWIVRPTVFVSGNMCMFRIRFIIVCITITRNEHWLYRF